MVVHTSISCQRGFSNFLQTENGTNGQILLEDIPLNAATGLLINFIRAVRNCSSDSELEALFDSSDGPADEQIIASSGWDTTEPVTMVNF